MRVTICSTRSGNPDVHKAGCRDIARAVRSGAVFDCDDFEVASRSEAAEIYWADFIGTGDTTSAEEYRDEFTDFYPCTRGLPEGEFAV